MGFLDNLFNMADKREIKAFSKVADKIDAMEPKFEAMTNKELKNMTNIFKERLAKGFKKSFRIKTLQCATYRGNGFTSR